LQALQRELARFAAANAQVLGINVDHQWSHGAWIKEMGGLDYPLLADFHPHGDVTRRYGLWRDDRGYGRRAVFIIDRQGVIRWAKVYERGLPDNEELLAALGEVED
jgi:alkyl hydroperoxide reductase subunit AhpC